MTSMVTGKKNKISIVNKSIIIGLVSLVFVVFAFIIMIFLTDGSKYAFKVSGLKVEKQELAFYMNNIYSTVAAEIEEKYSIDSFDDDFWNNDYNGVRPLEILKNKAKDEIVRIKTEQLIAKDYNIETLLTFSQQKQDCDAVNKQRAIDDINGKVIYGPVELDFSSYFTEIYMQMQNSLKKELEAKKITISDDETKQYYNEKKSEFKDESGSILTYEDSKANIYQYLFNIKYEEFIKDQVSKAKITIYKGFGDLEFK